MQIKRQKYFTSRLVAYASRLYLDQMARGERYNVLAPVYSLAFCGENLDEYKGLEDYYHVAGTMRLEPPHRLFNDRIKYIIVELGKFNKTPDELVDNRERWCYFLKSAHEVGEKELDEIRGMGEEMKQAVEYLEELSEDPQTRAEVEAYEKQWRDQQDREELQRDEGREEGIREGKKEIALSLLREKMDIQLVSKHTKLPLEEEVQCRL